MQVLVHQETGVCTVDWVPETQRRMKIWLLEEGQQVRCAERRLFLSVEESKCFGPLAIRDRQGDAKKHSRNDGTQHQQGRGIESTHDRGTGNRRRKTKGES